MCLNHLCMVQLKKTRRKGVYRGMKSFALSKQGIYPPMYYHSSLPIGRWLHERQYRPSYTKHLTGLVGNGRVSYSTGWHVWTGRVYSGFAEYMIEPGEKVIDRMVLFRNITATGKQRGYSVAVAKEMYIIPTFKERLIGWTRKLFRRGK